MKDYAFKCRRSHKTTWQSGVRAARQGKWLKDSSGQRLVTVTDGGRKFPSNLDVHPKKS